MQSRHFVDRQGNMWTRVNRREARTLYYNGDRIALSPVNVNPTGPLGFCEISREHDKREGVTFETLCNRFEAYNCNGETGRYLAYYVTYGPIVSVRAPRFSSGGSGYATADTLEVHINGYRLKNHEWEEELHRLADGINRGAGSPDFVHAILDPIAKSLVGRVAW